MAYFRLFSSSVSDCCTYCIALTMAGLCMRAAISPSRCHLLYDQPTGAILFMGSVLDPLQK
jgi:hypothetical protein